MRLLFQGNVAQPGAIAIAIVASLVALVLPAAAIGRSAPGTPTFCSPKKPARDFGFSKLPPVEEVPESALGIGHGAVSMYGGRSRVLTEPWSFGYGFSEQNYTGVVRLNWTVTAQLWTIDGKGTAFREVDREKLVIRRLNAAHQPSIEVDPLKHRRGFYRFDMQIENEGGKAIGSYSAYFKVVHPYWEPTLRLSRDALYPGEGLLARIDNVGTETVSFVEAFSVQRLENEAWISVPDLTPRRWRMWLASLGAGGTGRCNSLSIPADAPPGTYRIVKGVGTESWPEGRYELLTAPFVVLGSGASIEY